MSSSSISSHDSEYESSDSSSEFGDRQSGTNEREFQTPKKRKYRRSLHYGLSNKRANYHKVTPEKSASLHSFEHRDNFQGENNPKVSSNSPEYDYDSCSSYSLSQSSITSSASGDVFLSTTSDHAFDSDGSDASVFNTFTDSDSVPEQSYDFVGEEKSRQEPLYEGCKLSEHTAYTMIMLFVHKHSLSNEAFSDLLLIISAHLPQSAKFAKSTYKVKEILKTTIGFQEPILHHYCDICQRYCQDGNICENEACRRNNSRMREFHDLRLEDQLKDMLKGLLYIVLYINIFELNMLNL